MSAKRPADFSLTAAVTSKGFTPGVKDVAGLLALLAGDDDDLAQAAAKALLRVPGPAAKAVALALPASVRPQRARLADLTGRLASAGETPDTLAGLLLTLLRDKDLKAEINAIQALGRLPGEATEAALLERLAESPRREIVNALVRALGRSGTPRARTALAALAANAAGADERLLARSRLIQGREASRSEASAIAGDQPLPGLTAVHLHARRGLEALLIDEAAAAGLSARRAGPGVVAVDVTGPLAGLFKLRLFERLGLPLGERPLPPAAAAVAVLGEPLVGKLLKALTSGTVRYRIDWPEAKGPELWSLSERLAEAHPELVNDPKESLWELHLAPGAGGTTRLELFPKRLSDPRFVYRQGYVYAASHPTLAAALARVAGVVASDIVWDPFCGSGTELVERARLGAASGLFGTDLDPRAVETAQGNLAAAGIEATLSTGDCRTFAATRPTLILTNPPMGRRVHRGQLEPVLDGFIAHAASLLAPGGRLVWISPLPERTAAQLESLGLHLTFRQTVDMGGFDAEIQKAIKEP